MHVLDMHACSIPAQDGSDDHAPSPHALHQSWKGKSFRSFGVLRPKMLMDRKKRVDMRKLFNIIYYSPYDYGLCCAYVQGSSGLALLGKLPEGSNFPPRIDCLDHWAAAETERGTNLKGFDG